MESDGEWGNVLIEVSVPGWRGRQIRCSVKEQDGDLVVKGAWWELPAERNHLSGCQDKILYRAYEKHRPEFVRAASVIEDRLEASHPPACQPYLQEARDIAENLVVTFDYSRLDVVVEERGAEFVVKLTPRWPSPPCRTIDPRTGASIVVYAYHDDREIAFRIPKAEFPECFSE